MKRCLLLLNVLSAWLFLVPPAFAVGSDLTSFTDSTLQVITILATTSAVFFLMKGGIHYITSTGSPEHLTAAKKTIRNALIGLTFVLGANMIISLLQNAFTPPAVLQATNNINLAPLSSQTSDSGITQVLINAVFGLIQTIVQSATKPIIDSILTFLTSTPSLVANSTIFHFWGITVGIVDTLFVLVVGLLGLHFMSAATFGFEELELKQILPRIGLSFLGANTSLFLADFVISAANAVNSEIIHTTGGLDHAWIVSMINPTTLLTNHGGLVTAIFLLVFLVIACILLLMYIVRLIVISVAGVLSPFIFLIWAMPKFADFAEITVKGYITSVFMVFIHVVVIQLASAFLAIPEQGNPLLAIIVAIGLLFTLLKIPTWLFQMLFYTSNIGRFTQFGGVILNSLHHTKEGKNRTADSHYHTPYLEHRRLHLPESR